MTKSVIRDLAQLRRAIADVWASEPDAANPEVFEDRIAETVFNTCDFTPQVTDELVRGGLVLLVRLLFTDRGFGPHEAEPRQ
jgi:hypothetical protein